VSLISINVNYTDRIRFADQDIFMCYVVTGVGHDAVHLARHAHGLVDDNLPADNKEEDISEMEESKLSGVLQNDSEVDEEDEADEESDLNSGNNASDDSDSDADTHF